MNHTDPKVLAAFISQRMEMGETEWYINPGPAVSNILNYSAGPVHAAENSSTQQQPPGNIQMTNEPPHASSTFSDAVMTPGKSLRELYDAVSGCTRCPLGLTRTNFVFGEGNPDAGIMFIGEAPGAEEDKQGIPFVGRAGNLLTKMIIAMKLRREDVFIGNILKCRPPNNRDPKPDEIEKCEPILLSQIDIIKPKVICALGRISGQTLLRTKATLGSLRGKIHDYHGVKLIVTYHPAALLRNVHWKSGAWEDLKLVRREYDGMEL